MMTAFAPRPLPLNLAILVTLLIAVSPWTAIADTPPAFPDPAAQAQLAENYGKLTLSFEENQGQSAGEVKFLSRGPGYSLFLTPTEAVMTLRKAKSPSSSGKLLSAQNSIREPGVGADLSAHLGIDADSPAPQPPPVRMNSHRQSSRAGVEAREIPAAQNPEAQKPDETQGAVLRMRLAGAREPSSIVGKNRQPGTANYLKGRDPAQWRTGVARYGKVEYQGVYPGVDLVYYGNQRQLEYDFIVAPGADPKQIRLGFAADGGQAITPRMDTNGDLLLPTESGEVRLHKPVVYQEIGGQRREVEGRFVLLPSSSPPVETGRGEGNREVGFQVAEYDHDQALVIDPILVYSTYLGGTNNDNIDAWGHGIAVDSSGNAYVVGWTESANFPTVNPKYPQLWGGKDAFITKLSANGQTVVYSTYLGGSGQDYGSDITVDGTGNAYVTGWTGSRDFPTVNAKYPQLWGDWDAFVTKLSANGRTVIYSTYLGGKNYDFGYGITADSAGNAYVTGVTWSANFPTVNARYPQLWGSWDAFVTKLNASGQKVIYSTYLGGSDSEEGTDIAVDSIGNAYVTGWTFSADFPTVNARYRRFLGDRDAFVTKLSANGHTVIYSTYLGGGSEDWGNGIAVDSTGNACVTGWTGSVNFPFVNSKYSQLRGNSDAFVTKLNADGKTVIYSIYLGGSNNDYGNGIVLDSTGNAYVTGWTNSINFPAFNTNYSQPQGGQDAFITKLSANGQAVVYSSYLGGTNNDSSYGVALDKAGNVYTTGITNSLNFPSSATDPKIVSYDPTYNGGTDVFVAKLANYALSIVKNGTGQGTVTSIPGGINCGTACSKAYAQPTSVRLTAKPAANSRFVRWEGHCTGTALTCALAVNEGKQATAVFDSTLALDAKPLIDSLTLLKQRMTAKVDADLATTARAFGDSKNLQRSLVWSDWFGTLLDLVNGTISTIATATDIKALLTNKFKSTTDAYKLGIWTYSAYSLYQTLNEDGEKLQLAIDGPAYSRTVKAMLKNAYNTACVVVLGKCVTFNQRIYETAITNSLNQSSSSMVLALHRSSDVKRKKFEAVKGAVSAKLRINQKLQSLINTLQTKRTVPADFPMQATLNMLKVAREQVTSPFKMV